MDVLFRLAKATDVGQIVEFQLAMAWETEKLRLDPETCARGVQAVFERPHLGQYHLCQVDGQVVGSLMILTEWSDWRNGQVWWIHSLYILEQNRGKGVFSQFFKYIQALAKADSTVRGLRLYVDKSNVHARKVYESLGMNGDHYLTYEMMWA